MIRINLLPFRAARKKENVRRQLSVYGLSVACLMVVMIFVFLRLNGRVSELRARDAHLKNELAGYAKTNEKIAEIKKKIEEIQSKLDVINSLKESKQGPVLLLEEIARAVPKDKLWLRGLVEKKGVLTLEGSAMDNDTVALFMTGLEKAPHIVSVDLTSTRLKTLMEYKLDIAEFLLTCKTYQFKEETPEGEEGEKGSKTKKKRR